MTTENTPAAPTLDDLGRLLAPILDAAEALPRKLSDDERELRDAENELRDAARNGWGW